MSINYLEQLLAEWYEYQGFFVRRNVRVGKLAGGGYECELDIVAFHPEKRQLVHVEPSMDGDSWNNREARFRKKFNAGQKHIHGLFRGVALPTSIEQIAVFCCGSSKKHDNVAGGKVIMIWDLYREITAALSHTSTASSAVPERFSIVRTLQFVGEWRTTIWPDIAEINA